MRASSPVLPAFACVLCIGGCSSTLHTGGREPVDPNLVTSEDFATPNESIEQLLQRRVPGLVVSRAPDGSLVLRVRGATTWQGVDRPPLYVVNDAIVAPGPFGELPALNPQDIESIKVLKGPAAALYGIDGAYGVIVIRTRMPGQTERAGGLRP